MNVEFLSNIKAQNADFILRDFLPIPRNAVTLLSASGGTGKTRLSLIMADRFVKSERGNVALWLTEDYAGQVRHIVDDMIKIGLIDYQSINRMALILDEPPQLAKRDKGLFKANYEEINKIGNELINKDIAMTVFDPLLAFYGGNENDNSEARVFIQSFAEWAKNSKITTIIIHHSNKDGNSRGATAFHDGVRARYELNTIKDKDGDVDKDKLSNGIRLATLKKDNWGARKYLWALTDGSDNIEIQVAPPLKNEYKRESQPIEEYSFNSKENDNIMELFQ